MSENEMGYRGSKSVLVNKTVKEQRVDGSWSIKAKSKQMLLRCTLMGFERNYQIKIPSKQIIHKQHYSGPGGEINISSLYSATTDKNLKNKYINP